MLLDSVSQPFNVGSIIRTAAAFGAEHIWLCGNSAPPDHPSARKTALGTQRLRQLGARAGPGGRRPRRPPRRACGSSRSSWPPAPCRCTRPPLDGDICLALGNEDHGCSAALLAAADVVAYIPQLGRVGSLNVAAAAAIALAEARRRHGIGSPQANPAGWRPGRHAVSVSCHPPFTACSRR